MRIKLIVNGVEHALEVEPRTTLLDCLRHDAYADLLCSCCDVTCMRAIDSINTGLILQRFAIAKDFFEVAFSRVGGGVVVVVVG